MIGVWVGVVVLLCDCVVVCGGYEVFFGQVFVCIDCGIVCDVQFGCEYVC